MARKSKQELEKLKQKYNVNELWSWSKYNTYKTDKYGYFLKYIKKIKEDRKDGIYAISGGIAHEIIEDYYEKNISNEEMLKKYEDKLFEFNLAELKYDRTDEEKNEKIANKYEACLKHFFKHHIKIDSKVQIEKFLSISIDKFLFQAYLDAVHVEVRDNIKKIIITDWKTSSLYVGEKINKEMGQLVLYAEGIRQKLNIPIENIVARWNFLKYVEVEYTQAKGDIKTRIILRNEIASKLTSNIKMWLKKGSYSEKNIELYLDKINNTNSLDCLPKEILSKFKINDCYVEIPLSEEVINNLKNDIKSTIIEIKKRELEYSKSKNEHVFWQEISDKDSYFFANLSGYSRKLHKPYDEYLKNKDMFKDEVEEDDNEWLKELGL